MDQKDKILDVKKDGNYSYPIWLEPDFQKLPEALEQLHVSGRKLCIVSDSNVDTLYGTQLKEVLSGIPIRVVRVCTAVATARSR